MRIEVVAWRSPWVLFIEMVEDPSDEMTTNLPPQAQRSGSVL